MFISKLQKDISLLLRCYVCSCDRDTMETARNHYLSVRNDGHCLSEFITVSWKLQLPLSSCNNSDNSNTNVCNVINAISQTESYV